MKAILVWAVTAVVALALALPAFAQPGPYGRPGKGQERVRDDRGPGPRGVGQLSPDERRALRRDIIQHGQDHYRGGPGNPPPQHPQHPNRR